MASDFHRLIEPLRVGEYLRSRKTLAPDAEPHSRAYPGCGSVPVTWKCLRVRIWTRLRPDNESVTPPRSPSSFTFSGPAPSLPAWPPSSPGWSFPLGRLFLGFGLPLLRPAFLLLGLVAGQRAPGFFRLAFRLVFHGYSFPSMARCSLDYWFEAPMTSLTVMRPSAPVPCTWLRSTPSSWAFCCAACVAFGCC